MTLLRVQNDVELSLLKLIETSCGQNLFACYQCGKCTASCPFSNTPQLIMRYLQLGQAEEALKASTTWTCAFCQTCKTVCPRGVSPARVIKILRKIECGEIPFDHAEALNLIHLDAKPPAHRLRAAFFANINLISRVGSRTAPLSNWMMNAPGAKSIAHYVIGVHKSRELPKFEKPSFQDWFKKHEPKSDGPMGEVVLFHDTFMDYELTNIGIATTSLLELSGYHVTLSDTVCCGRPMLSKGQYVKAKEHARINVDRLYEQAAAGLTIVGCEPSCLLTLRKEYPELMQNSAWAGKAKVVAQKCLLIDEFLFQHWKGRALEIGPKGDSEERHKILFHGHCWQKSEADVNCTIKILELAGFDVTLIPASCCGMAGAFGFEKEHFALSKKAAERALLPTIRAHPGVDIAVMGISCRKQIEDLAEGSVRHVVEYLDESARLACTQTLPVAMRLPGEGRSM